MGWKQFRRLVQEPKNQLKGIGSRESGDRGQPIEEIGVKEIGVKEIGVKEIGVKDLITGFHAGADYAAGSESD